MASLDRRTFLKTLVGISTSFLTVPQLLLLHGDPTSAASWDLESPLIHPPTTAEPLATFRHELVGWRRSRKSALEYDDRRYRNPAYQWVSSNFACCFLMLWDEQLYDPKAGVYTMNHSSAMHVMILVALTPLFSGTPIHGLGRMIAISSTFIGICRGD
jgi:hypothetical protein